MLILGIDPGTLKVGYGLVLASASRFQVRGYGVIRARRTDPPARRLAHIFGELQRLVAEHGPDAVAIEDGFCGPNPKTALRIGEGRGAAMVAASSSGVPITTYSPSTVKRAVTGTGRAGKAPVAEMVRILLGLAAPPESDAADALAVAICHGQRGALAPNGLQQTAG